ncbi:hypothetical protein [Novosphingobium resinovorum]|uniref:Uncharacterized protein n=1 Tax=Novosphingobium resinovorum TaxID=158500 RepID=A0A1D8A567_9SPHN|nr:hypothetical protein [Novosphingobium resinovorum]AOR77236.1 hypothetical protein BES08_11090 [Novosphingobium resinovorum]
MSVLFAKFRSEIFGMIGVLAVCGVGALIVAWLHIQRQDDQISTQATQITALADANKGWVIYMKRRDQLRDAEQRNTLLLQDKLTLIEGQNAANAAQLQKLRDENAEVREYLSRPIPADLRRLLDKK